MAIVNRGLFSHKYTSRAIDAEFEVVYSLAGRYIPATETEPEELPEPSIEAIYNEHGVLVTIDDTGDTEQQICSELPWNPEP